MRENKRYRRVPRISSTYVSARSLFLILLLCEMDFTDVEDVKFVINFDYPSCSEDYVHRIGRTGRRQKTGTAYTFFTPNNSNKANDLIQVLKEANQVINPKLLELADGRNGGNGGNSGFGRHRGPL